LKQKENVEKSVSEFLNRDEKELVFKNYCRLENKGMTIDVEVIGEAYTFTCNNLGEIVSVSKIGVDF